MQIVVLIHHIRPCHKKGMKNCSKKYGNVWASHDLNVWRNGLRSLQSREWASVPMLLDLYTHTNLCTWVSERERDTHTHKHTRAYTNEAQLCTHCAWLKKKLQKAHQCGGPYLSVGPRDSLSLHLSIPIYYITKSDNRKKANTKR